MLYHHSGTSQINQEGGIGPHAIHWICQCIRMQLCGNGHETI